MKYYSKPIIVEVDLTADLTVLASCNTTTTASESGCNCGNSGCSVDKN